MGFTNLFTNVHKPAGTHTTSGSNLPPAPQGTLACKGLLSEAQYQIALKFLNQHSFTHDQDGYPSVRVQESDKIYAHYQLHEGRTSGTQGETIVISTGALKLSDDEFKGLLAAAIEGEKIDNEGVMHSRAQIQTRLTQAMKGSGVPDTAIHSLNTKLKAQGTDLVQATGYQPQPVMMEGQVLSAYQKAPQHNASTYGPSNIEALCTLSAPYTPPPALDTKHRGHSH